MEETPCARGIVEAVIAEARSAHGELESRVASLVVQVVGALSEQVREMAAHSKAETSHVVGSIAQQLEKEIEAAMESVVTISE